MYIAVLVLLFFVGILANGSLIYLFFRVKSLRDINNAFITNLAMGDVLYTTIFIPIRIYEKFFFFRPFGLTFCYFSISINYISQDVSIFSLTALSVIRFKAVVFPLAQPPRRRKCVTLIGCLTIWIVSLLLAIGPVDQCREYTMTDCLTNKTVMIHTIESHAKFFKCYSLLQFFVLFLMPLIVISILYGSMSYKLFCVNLPMGNASGGTNANRSRRRLATIVLVLVVTFAVCWFPYHVYSIMSQFGWLYNLDAKVVFQDVQFFLTMLSSVVNPIILYLTSSSFRNHLVGVACHCFGRREWTRIDTNITTVRTTAKSNIAKRKKNTRRPNSSISTTAI
ncbi:Bombesin receptor subtype-3 [Holothuria leucospilota]|uniref:Bombesin receptor subtype-3 n=1 Tax=Holothuria leucospilota TaxID=206669 RepID=A0A9Q1BJJ4_HOLLE|nr:Bombesin receptor subtype-3 [Holothuria leucospilota]